MPKRDTNSNEPRGQKSAAVRDLLEQTPKMPVREIVAHLASRGITINPNLVYYIKGRMKQRRGQQKRRLAVRAGRNAGVANPVELVRSVKHLALQAGGMRRLKELVDILAE
jgi:hypothetical protein